MASSSSPSLERFLGEWLGAWPPASARQVVASPLRDDPEWDGVVRPVEGVADSDGQWVVSVAPDRAASAEPLAGLDLFEGVFRWSLEPAELEPAGVWIPFDDPVVPAWLQPFGGEVLAVVDDGRYVAGVGLKRHLSSGWEISVGTEPEARGRGLARRLVATAARRVLALGAVPIYLHADDNTASAKAAEAAGFPDLGWRTMSIADP